MRRSSVLKVVIAVLLALSLCGVESARGEIYLVDFDEPQAEFLMMQAVNSLRYREGLPLLGLDATLSKVSRRHALDMARRDYFDHFTPEGRSPDDRAHAAGVPNEVSENIGIIRTFGQDIQEVVNALMESFLESPEHRANLLNPDFTHIGIGFYQDLEGSNHRLNGDMDADSLYSGYGTLLVVQDFCRRKVTLLEPSPFTGWAEPGEYLTLRLDFAEEADEAFLRIVPLNRPSEAYDVPLSNAGRGFRARFAIESEGAFTIAIYANSLGEDWYYREHGRLELMVKSHQP